MQLPVVDFWIAVRKDIVMKSTCIANGQELVHRKARLPAGYKTPTKSAQLAKRRARRKKLRNGDDHVPVAHPEKVRTLNDVVETDVRTVSKMREGGVSRMRNHR
jgi:hypothetical protein